MWFLIPPPHPCLPQGSFSIILAFPFFPSVIMISTLIPTRPVKVYWAYRPTIPSMHVESMNQPPHSVIPFILVVGLYLCILVWHTIKGGANLFRLTPPDPMPPSNNLGMDIKFGSPWNFFVWVPRALIVFLHPSCFEVSGAVNISISFGSHNVKPN
jgi:hypothetical protein